MDLSSLPSYPPGKGVRWVQPPAVNRDFSRRGELLMKFLMVLAVLGAVFFLRWRLLPAGTVEANQPSTIQQAIIGKWEMEDNTPFGMVFTADGKVSLLWNDRFFIQGNYEWERPDQIRVTQLQVRAGEGVREEQFKMLWFKVAVTKTELVIAEPNERDFGFGNRNNFVLPPLPDGETLQFKRKQ